MNVVSKSEKALRTRLLNRIKESVPEIEKELSILNSDDMEKKDIVICRDNAIKKLSKMEDDIKRLKNIDNENEMIIHYEKMINQWKEQLIEINPTSLKSTLAELSMKIDTLMEQNQDASSVISRFKYAFALLKSLVPNDTMISYYESKPKEWEVKEKSNNKKSIIFILCLFLLGLILSIIGKLFDM